ncbi:MAG: SOS response-associated peptidase [Verrucomicrobiia bacterium]
MCGRFTLTAEAKELAKRFGIEISASFYKTVAPRYNIAPTQPVVVLANDGKRCLMQMRWGLIPSWAKDPAVGNRMINARSETLTSRPAFRVSIRKRRCLILADGFYEWKKTGTVKQPVRIVLKNCEPFGFAGLWDNWKSPNGNEIATCTIITTEANDLIATIHDRMPVVLPRQSEDTWLDPESPLSELLALLKPYPSDQMEFYPVSRAVNSPGYNSPDCIVPI